MKTETDLSDSGLIVPKFLPSEWLTYRQVASYFSRRRRIRQQEYPDTSRSTEETENQEEQLYEVAA